ncbi:hypothetical protein H257_16905 [Aphanomyces astaci]|uniref:Uncharacterized protein n=1 Tax=Aphanomyces astaci TaxID=112090 RepID=W4FGW9_APHAT|nr:hypothetical protein H257_16905 [Aphanomyces astaci]ETV66695.1 hypothetical protein H257_16905 [Aphanomyces astaci]|eukprot:XP_009843820.1 hypothetical protein H257_16905 [Aphanomyces astaci]
MARPAYISVTLLSTSTSSPVAPACLLRRYSAGTVADTATRVDTVTASPIWTHGIAPAATPNTHPPLAGTYVAPTQARAVQVATATRDTTHIPPPNTPPRKATKTNTKPRQLPLQRHPHQVPGHTTGLNLYLQRELSTYVDQRIVSATTPLRQEVESLRADKEALAALVSASSAAFSSLDARLLEERRRREAAELLHAEDNCLRTEAHVRPNTAVTQHESQ